MIKRVIECFFTGYIWLTDIL